MVSQYIYASLAHLIMGLLTGMDHPPLQGGIYASLAHLIMGLLTGMDHPPLRGGIYASLAQFGRASDFYPNQFNWFGK